MLRLLTTFCLACLFFTLPAQEWIRQNPLYEPLDLHAIAMHEDGHGLATGRRGAIWTTANYGVNWTFQEPISFSTLSAAAVYDEGNIRLFLAAANNRLYTSTDDGAIWNFTTLSPTLGSTRFLHAFTATTYLVGGSNGLLQTTDSGQTWTDISPVGDDLSFQSFSFISSMRGWASTDDGRIYGTFDGGQTWTVLSEGTFTQRITLAFLDANIGYGGHFRDLIKTTDGGQTWTTVLPDAFGSHIDGITIIDADNVAISQGNRTYYTHDGGMTAPIVFPTNYSSRNRAITSLSDGRVWVASSYNSIFFSDDAGETYVDQIPGQKNFLRFIDFTADGQGVAGGGGSAILYTNDYGNTWIDRQQQLDPSGEIFMNDGLISDTDDLLIAADHTVRRSSDGGSTWTTLLDASSTIGALAKRGSVLHAVDYSGKVHRSTDAGATWTTTNLQDFTLLYDIHFVDDQTGHIVGRNGFAARTTDGGLNWTVLTTPDESVYGFVHFRTPLEGWIGFDGFSSSLLYTDDGGATWSDHPLPASSVWNNLQSVDDSTLYLGGGSSGNGLVYITTDNGMNWELLYNSDQAVAGMHVQVDGDDTRIWISGAGGNIELGQYGTVGVDAISSPLSFRVYPNPAQEVISLQLPPSLSTSATLTVYTEDGRRVHQQKVSPTLDVRHWPSGTYRILIQEGENVYSSRVSKL